MVLENCLISKTFATFSSIRILVGYRACHVTYQLKSVLQWFDAWRPITEPDAKSSVLIGQNTIKFEKEILVYRSCGFIRILAEYRACHVTYQLKSVLQYFYAVRPITEPDTESSLLIGQPASNLWSEFKLIYVKWQACNPAGIPSKVLFIGL